MPERVALFGGSFNPVHNGHLISARSAAEALDVDRVVFLPSRTPPHKVGEPLASADHRAAMVRGAITGEDLFDISDHDLTCDGLSYTVTTVAHFRDTFPPPAELFWLVGADSLLELHTWYKPDDIARTCRIVTAVRPGSDVGDLPELRRLLDAARVEQLLSDVVETPRIDISATDIRRRVARSQSISYLVPEFVERYIHDHGLYRA